MKNKNLEFDLIGRLKSSLPQRTLSRILSVDTKKYQTASVIYRNLPSIFSAAGMSKESYEPLAKEARAYWESYNTNFQSALAKATVHRVMMEDGYYDMLTNITLSDVIYFAMRSKVRGASKLTPALSMCHRVTIYPAVLVQGGQSKLPITIEANGVFYFLQIYPEI